MQCTLSFLGFHPLNNKQGTSSTPNTRQSVHSDTHTHTRTHTHTHTDTHTHTHTHTHGHTHTHTDVELAFFVFCVHLRHFSLSLTHTHAHTHTLSLSVLQHGAYNGIVKCSNASHDAVRPDFGSGNLKMHSKGREGGTAWRKHMRSLLQVSPGWNERERGFCGCVCVCVCGCGCVWWPTSSRRAKRSAVTPAMYVHALLPRCGTWNAFAMSRETNRQMEARWQSLIPFCDQDTTDKQKQCSWGLCLIDLQPGQIGRGDEW